MDRFQATAEVLDGFRSGRLDPAVPDPGWSPWSGPGVHPASLLLCASAGDLPRLEPVKAALARLGPAFDLVPVITSIPSWPGRPSPTPTRSRPGPWHARGPGQRAAGPPAVRARAHGPGQRPRPRPGPRLGGPGRLRLEDLPRLHDPVRAPGRVWGPGTGWAAGPAEPGAGHPGARQPDGGRMPGPGALGPGLRVAGAVWMDALPAGFQAGQAWLRRLQTPWPGIAPRPVPLPGLPPGALRLVGGQAPGPGEPGIPVT